MYMFVLNPHGKLQIIPEDRELDVLDWVEDNDDPKILIHFYADIVPPEDLE